MAVYEPHFIKGAVQKESTSSKLIHVKELSYRKCNDIYVNNPLHFVEI